MRRNSKRVPLLLERVRLGVGVAEQLDACVASTSVAWPFAGDAFTSPSMATLAPVWRCLTTALVVRQFARRDDLHVALARAVVEFDEAEAALGVAARAHPASQAHLLADGLGLAGLGHGDLFHEESPGSR